MRRLILVFTALLSLTAFTQPVFADQKDSGPWERFSFNLGGFITSLNTDVRIGIEQVGAGIEIDVEDALGLDSSTSVIWGGLMYRFGRSRRHRVDFSYSDFRRDATRVLEKDIEIGDKTITVGERVRSEFNFSVIRGQYSYSFFQDDRMDLSAGIGLYVMPIELQLETATERVADEAFIAPLPTLYLEGDFAITPKLFLKAGYGILYLKIGDFKGAILDSRLALEYHVWKHVGFGLGIDRLQVEIEAEDDNIYPGVDFIGNLTFNYTGVLLYTKIYF
jgi:hypothetical protein